MLWCIRWTRVFSFSISVRRVVVSLLVESFEVVDGGFGEW